MLNLAHAKFSTKNENALIAKFSIPLNFKARILSNYQLGYLSYSFCQPPGNTTIK